MDPSKVVSIFKTYDDPKNQRGAASFPTFMIIAPTCFFLGMLFQSFPYDYPLLWTSEVTPDAYFDQLETHLRFLHASPPLISRILHIAITIGFSGFFLKLFKPSEANLLFDGASLVLYTIGVVVYITNIVKGLRIVTEGVYDHTLVDGVKIPPTENLENLVNREDSLRVLAASNTILALVLIGVLFLQAGQWYAERKDQDEAAKFAEEKREKAAEKAAEKGSAKGNSHATRSASKKKQ